MARMPAARSSFDILLIVAFAFDLATAADALVSATASTTAAFAGGAEAFGDGDFEELANEATAFEGGVEAIAFAVGGEPTVVAPLCFLAGEGVAAATSGIRWVTGDAVFAGGGIAFAFACALTSACALVLTMSVQHRLEGIRNMLDNVRRRRTIQSGFCGGRLRRLGSS